jgi:hypothetical protein
MTIEQINDFLKKNLTPPAWRYTLVLASVTKRLLGFDIPLKFRQAYLDHLEKMTVGSDWCNADVITAVGPMDDAGYEMICEIGNLGWKKGLDVAAEMFASFAALNPSLIEALKSTPRYLHLNGVALDAYRTTETT